VKKSIKLKHGAKDISDNFKFQLILSMKIPADFDGVYRKERKPDFLPVAFHSRFPVHGYMQIPPIPVRTPKCPPP